MSRRQQGERSREETWGERELSKYIGTSGSPKAQPRDKQHPTTSRDPKHPTRRADRTSDKQTSSPAAAKRTDSKTDRRTTSDKPRTDASRQKPRETSRKGATESDRKREDAKSRTKDPEPKSRDQRKRDPKGSSRSKDSQKSRERGRQATETKESRGTDKDTREGGRKATEGKESRGTDKEKGREQGSSDVQLVRDNLHSSSRGSLQKAGVTLSESLSEQQKSSKNGGVSDYPSAVVEGKAEGAEGAGGEGTLQPMVEMTEEIEEDVYKDDDFEQDYDEDFEEELESTGSEEEEAMPSDHTHQGPVAVDLVEIMQAIDAENELLERREEGQRRDEEQRSEEGTQQHSGPSTLVPSHGGRRSLVPSHGGRRSLVDFSAAQKRERIEKVASKTRKRGQALLSMIELDIVGYDMFELPPLSEYELYIKNFGSEDARQVSVQTGEDNTETEAQTDEVPLAEKWVQWPPEDLRGYGGPGEELDAEDLLLAPLSGQSALRLVSFLKRATQVCCVLLEENLALCHGQVPFQSSKSPFPFCSSCLNIQTPPFLEGRHVTTVQFCPSQDHLILAAYSQPPSTTEGDGLRGRGLVCLWNIREPSRPQQVLVCESVPTCCCFSPQKISLVFAGNEDGSVVLWDLREPLSMHRPSSEFTNGDSLGITPRVPTFSTAGIPNLDSHHSPLVSITPLTVEVAEVQHSLLDHSEGGASGLSFQLATMDRNGQLNIWVVVEIYHPDPHGSESDFGLVPGGRVKLVKSTTIDVCKPSPRSPSAVGVTQARCLQFHPTDTNHLYIGTDTGNVYHHTRYGRRPIPRYYLPNSEQETGGIHVCDVTSLSLSPWQPDHFLSGSSDGTIRLYQTTRGVPRVCWPRSTGGVGITRVQWSEHKPGVFLVVDDQSNLYLWDLLKSDVEPLHKQQLKTSVTHCSFSPHINSPHTRQPSILLSLSTGIIELHSLDNSFISSSTNSEKLFQDYLESIV